MNLTATLPTKTTEAGELATKLLQSNLDAMCDTQPQVAAQVSAAEAIEFVFARDDSLSARAHERWWSGCSVPRLTALAALRKLDLQGSVACFIAPPHAAHLRVALDRLREEQAIVAIVPDPTDLSLMLHCGDFANDIRAHRLWFAAGAGWRSALAHLLDERPGLATPSQFIRLPHGDERLVGEIIGSAQTVFSEVTARRTARINALQHSRRAAPTGKLCVVAPSRFRMWNDVGQVLLDATMRLGERAIHFDPDDPARSSPLELAQVVHGCDTILTANTARSDLPGELVPISVRWISWLTTPRVPRFCAEASDDRLLCIDEALVRRAAQHGWPSGNVHLARWPRIVLAPESRPTRPLLGIFADTQSLERPQELNDYSSHGLLWDMIRQELLDDPFRVGTDVAGYLRDRMRRLEIPSENFPAARFIDGLIMPAYQQSVTRLLIRAGLPLRLYGSGWDSIDDLAGARAGEMLDRQQFERAVGSVTAIVSVWPVESAHPSAWVGMPVIRTQRNREALVLAARRAVAGTFEPPAPTSPAFDSSIIRSILNSC